MLPAYNNGFANFVAGIGDNFRYQPAFVKNVDPKKFVDVKKLDDAQQKFLARENPLPGGFTPAEELQIERNQRVGDLLGDVVGMSVAGGLGLALNDFDSNWLLNGGIAVGAGLGSGMLAGRLGAGLARRSSSLPISSEDTKAYLLQKVAGKEGYQKFPRPTKETAPPVVDNAQAVSDIANQKMNQPPAPPSGTGVVASQYVDTPNTVVKTPDGEQLSIPFPEATPPGKDPGVVTVSQEDVPTEKKKKIRKTLGQRVRVSSGAMEPTATTSPAQQEATLNSLLEYGDFNNDIDNLLNK